MKELQEKLQALKDKLNKKEQGYLCLRSIENFLLYFDQLQGHRSKVENLLNGYFEEVEQIIKQDDYFIDFSVCKILTRTYIIPIGRYYGIEQGFKLRLSLSGVLFWGFQIDILLLIFKLLKKVNYIPVVTLLFLTWWVYQQIFYASKHKTYGVKY